MRSNSKMNDLRLRKSERIASRKQIDQLFAGKGSQSKAAFPVRAVFYSRPYMPYMANESHEPEADATLPQAQILVSVPKKRFKHAVDRNRVKRQLREAYRKNKHLMLEAIPEGVSVAIAFIWLSDKRLPSVEVEERMKRLLADIAQVLSNNHKPCVTSASS